jgi:hypothetical protein
MTAMQEFVVPKSMPITLAIKLLLLYTKLQVYSSSVGARGEQLRINDLYTMIYNYFGGSRMWVNSVPSVLLWHNFDGRGTVVVAHLEAG